MSKPSTRISRLEEAGLKPRQKDPLNKGVVAPEGPPPVEGGRFAYEGLDRVIHERARLSVLTSLITNPKGLLFNELKQLCSLTDGNLSRHLTVLESEYMVELLKENDRTRPQTICRITPTGRKRYLEYLQTLEQVVKDAARLARKETTVPAHHSLSPSRA